MGFFLSKKFINSLFFIKKFYPNLLFTCKMICSSVTKLIPVYVFKYDAEITDYAVDAIYNVVSNEPVYTSVCFQV